MSLDVGELVARLTLDDSRFIQGTQRSEQQSRQSTQRISNGFQDITRAAARAGEAAQAVEINRQLDRQAQQAAQRIQELERNAQRADQSVDDIAMNDRLLNEARDAARQIDDIRAGARQAAGALNDIELGNRLRQDLQAAQGDLDDLYRQAGDGGGSAGDQAGGNFLSGFSDSIGNLASKTGPIAGSILGVAALGLAAGAALAGAIREGMQGEQNQDLFQAQTATTEAQARKFALAAGESYADAFGESVQANLSTLKLALQNNIIDKSASQRDAEAVVANLETISQALDGEVTESVNAVSALMSTGLAANAQEAADMIANAVGGSANKGQDLLEVIWEYSAGWKNAGVSAEQALALIEQATDNGAWNADVPGDALREFGRRIDEEGETIVATLNSIGLNGTEMFDAFVEGGDKGNEAFDKMWDTIRAMKDPIEQETAILALLGDTSGDFMEVWKQWDPSEALANFGEFEGAAARLAGIIGGNTATSVEGAMRSIETVSTGMKEALAQAFGPYIKDFADNISNNRAGVIQFFIDVGNGAFELGKSVLGFVEGGIRGLADFAGSASETGASFLEMGANILSVGESIPGFGAILGIATGGAADKLRDLAEKTREGGAGIGKVLTGAADGIHDTLIPALDQAQGRFNEFAGEMKLSAAFNDESAKVTKAIGEIGVAADGSKLQLEGWNGAIDRNNQAQVQMEDGIKGLAKSFEAQIRTGMEAGNTVEALTGQYNDNRVALIDQLIATGMSNKAAVEYVDKLGLIPEFVATTIQQPGMPEAQYELDVLKEKAFEVPDSKTVVTEALTEESVERLQALGLKVETLPDGKVKVFSDTEEATRALEDWLMRNGHREIVIKAQMQRIAAVESTAPAWSAQRAQDYFGVTQADGSVRTRADGMIDTAHIQQGSGQGIYTKSPLGPVQYAEGETQWEAYIPGAPSKRKRSEAILQDVARRFGFGLIKPETIRMADGGVVDKNGLDASMSWARSMDPATYLMGGFSSKAIDCSGAVSGAVNTMLGLDAFDSRMSTVTEGAWLQAKGAILGRGGPGTVRIGWWDKGGGANGHTAMTYPDGTNFESNGSEGVVVGGKTGADDPQFDQHAYFPTGGDLGRNYGLPPDARTEEEKIADTIISEGKKRGMSDKQIKAAVMAALEESRLQNLDYGMDGDNKGILQQRDSWGTVEDRKDPAKAAGMFYDELAKLDSANMTEAQMAQAVQRSGTADGSNYADEAAEAERIIAASNARNNGQMTSAATTSGAVVATDGQRVFVTNWPGSSSSYSASESAPSTAPAGGTSEAAGKDPNLIWSGGFKVFENGGMNLPNQAGLYSDGADLIRFAEKGTGGESYIPLAPSKRSRSVAITRETARRFGYELVPMADGGLTGFGGYVGEKPGLKVPTTANGRRAAAYNAAAFGVGAAFALASGFDADGKFTGQFDTGANSSSQLEKGFENATKEIQPVLEQILLAIKNREPVNVQVDVNRDSGQANIAITKGGI